MINDKRRILLASSMTSIILMLAISPAVSQMTFAQTPAENITPFAAPDHAFSMGVGCDSFKLNASITEVRENCELSFRNVDLLGDTFKVTGVLSVSEDVAFDFDNGTMAITTATNVSGVTTCEVGGSFPCDLGELDRIIVTENSHTTSSAGTTSDEFSFFFEDLCDGIFDDSCPLGETNEGSISANTLVRKAMPDITTLSNVTGMIPLDSAVKDTATLSDGFFPTGTINFTLFKNTSGTPDCTDASQKVHSELVAVAGNGDYMSSGVVADMIANYTWLATYSGDGNNTDVTLPPNDDGMEEECNADGETFETVMDPGFIKITKVNLEAEDPIGLFGYESDIPGWEMFALQSGEMTPVIEVAPGTFNVTEANLPPMWKQISDVCDNGDVASMVTVEAGELVECTFVNDFEMNPGLWIIKQVRGTLPDGDYSFESDTPEGDFVITTVGFEGEFHIDDLPPGTYNVNEVNDEFLVSATCDNGDDPSAVTLEKDEMVTCTFVNRDRQVGGEFLPIDNTSLFLAGLNASMIWIVPTLAAIAGTGIYVAKTRLHKD